MYVGNDDIPRKWQGKLNALHTYKRTNSTLRQYAVLQMLLYRRENKVDKHRASLILVQARQTAQTWFDTYYIRQDLVMMDAEGIQASKEKGNMFFGETIDVPVQNLGYVGKKPQRSQLSS